MKTLIGYEKKKLLRRKSAMIACLLMVLCIFAASLVVISDQGWFQEDCTELSGIRAIRAERAVTQTQAGLLTPERLKSTLRRFHRVYGDPSNYNSETGSLQEEVYCREISPYRRILTLLARVYAPSGFYDIKVLNDVTEEMADSFYEIRHANVRTLLNMELTTGNFTQAEKDAALKLDQQVSRPFYYNYTGGWKALLTRTFSLSFLLITLALCVIISPVFGYEYQTGTDAVVLSAKRGRGEIVRAKITAGFLAASEVYALGVCAMLLCVLVPFGAEGWNCEFQLLSETSFYSLKIWQVALLGILINYIVMLSVMAFTMLLSAVCKTPFAAVIASMLCTAVPLFFPASNTSSLLNHILALLPAQAMDTYTVFSAYMFFPTGKTVVTLPYMIPIAASVLIVAALPLAHRGFCKHQVV